MSSQYNPLVKTYADMLIASASEMLKIDINSMAGITANLEVRCPTDPHVKALVLDLTSIRVNLVQACEKAIDLSAKMLKGELPNPEISDAPTDNPMAIMAQQIMQAKQQFLQPEEDDDDA